MNDGDIAVCVLLIINFFIGLVCWSICIYASFCPCPVKKEGKPPDQGTCSSFSHSFRIRTHHNSLSSLHKMPGCGHRICNWLLSTSGSKERARIYLIILVSIVVAVVVPIVLVLEPAQVPSFLLGVALNLATVPVTYFFGHLLKEEVVASASPSEWEAEF